MIINIWLEEGWHCIFLKIVDIVRMRIFGCRRVPSAVQTIRTIKLKIDVQNVDE
jgi:hypothetical protein